MLLKGFPAWGFLDSFHLFPLNAHLTETWLVCFLLSFVFGHSDLFRQGFPTCTIKYHVYICPESFKMVKSRNIFVTQSSSWSCHDCNGFRNCGDAGTVQLSKYCWLFISASSNKMKTLLSRGINSTLMFLFPLNWLHTSDRQENIKFQNCSFYVISLPKKM